MNNILKNKIQPGGDSDDDVDLEEFVHQQEAASYVSEDDYSRSDDDSNSVMGSGQFSSTHMPEKETELGGGFKIAQRENQAVLIWKMVVISAMILITIGVSIAVFVYVDSKEQQAFESNFQEDTFKIFSDLGGGIVQRFSQLDQMAIDLVSYANTSDSEWPYVTMPNYAVRASKSRRSSGAVAMETFYYINETNSGLVADRSRAEWQSYSRENGEEWMRRALALQEIDDSYLGDQVSPEELVEIEHSGIWYGNEVLPYNSGP
ncbi:MAG: hypothetical protein SGILL_006705 [Bacillariaceae sp.]